MCKSSPGVRSEEDSQGRGIQTARDTYYGWDTWFNGTVRVAQLEGGQSQIINVSEEATGKSPSLAL